MKSYDYLAAALARDWYQSGHQHREVSLQHLICEQYLAQCDTMMSKRILLLVSHQKALHLFLNDPENRKPHPSSFQRFERVSKRLGRLLQ